MYSVAPSLPATYHFIRKSPWNRSGNHRIELNDREWKRSYQNKCGVWLIMLSQHLLYYLIAQARVVKMRHLRCSPYIVKFESEWIGWYWCGTETWWFKSVWVNEWEWLSVWKTIEQYIARSLPVGVVWAVHLRMQIKNKTWTMKWDDKWAISFC